MYFYIQIKVWFKQIYLRIKNANAFIDTKAILRIEKNCDFTIGEGSSIRAYSFLTAVTLTNDRARLYIGRNTYIGEFNNIRVAGGEIVIGDNCLISQHITMVSSNHLIAKDQLIIKQRWTESKNFIRIEDDVWIGANSVILPGVVLHKGCVIAGGSVVTKDVPPYTIVAGNPARIIKYR